MLDNCGSANPSFRLRDHNGAPLANERNGSIDAWTFSNEVHVQPFVSRCRYLSVGDDEAALSSDLVVDLRVCYQVACETITDATVRYSPFFFS